MKTGTDKLEIKLSREELEKMTKEVKETLAFDVDQNKIFSSADLWNIQRRGKSMMSKRNCA